jgi:hypothetical protein
MVQQFTLKEVGKRALTDKKFFYDLVEDVDEALRRADLRLDEKDLDTLKTALKEPTPQGFYLKTFIEWVHSTGGKNPFSGWEADWLGGWVPPGWPRR